MYIHFCPSTLFIYSLVPEFRLFPLYINLPRSNFIFFLPLCTISHSQYIITHIYITVPPHYLYTLSYLNIDYLLGIQTCQGQIFFILLLFRTILYFKYIITHIYINVPTNLFIYSLLYEYRLFSWYIDLPRFNFSIFCYCFVPFQFSSTY